MTWWWPRMAAVSGCLTTSRLLSNTASPSRKRPRTCSRRLSRITPSFAALSSVAAQTPERIRKERRGRERVVGKRCVKGKQRRFRLEGGRKRSSQDNLGHSGFLGQSHSPLPQKRRGGRGG